MIFLPSCDKDVPLQPDCIETEYTVHEDLETYELEALDEKDVWNESEEQKEKVNKSLSERGSSSRQSR